MTREMKTAIEMRALSFNYEGYADKILNEANFSLDYGELSLLSGFSGEGKSTVLGLIAGIIPNITPGVVHGELKINGESSSQKKMSELCRSVGVVLQNAESQIIQQIVEDEIAFGCENFAFSIDKTTARIRQACEMMSLEPQWKTRTLSGGQKQRLMTAATLATEQRILILDEPLANLDKQGGQLLMHSLRQLAADGYAILIVEHRLDMVLPYVDSVWQIAQGKMIKIQDHGKYLESQASQIADTNTRQHTNEPILSLKHVAFAAGGNDILNDVSLEIHRGERLLLMGDNGSGKTTLMRLIARLLPCKHGQIRQHLNPAFGQKNRRSRQWFQAVGIVYQNPNYQLFMPTVREEIAFAATSEAYAEEIMDLFGLSDLADRHPHSISEGQKRRVSIAAVVAAEPDILLLDEPTVGQDYRGLQSLVHALNLIHERNGNTMITITHDMRCAEALCDRAVILDGGRIAEAGGKDLARTYFKRI